MYIYFISHHFNMIAVIKINYNHAIKSFNYINFLLINLYPYLLPVGLFTFLIVFFLFSLHKNFVENVEIYYKLL